MGQWTQGPEPEWPVALPSPAPWLPVSMEPPELQDTTRHAPLLLPSSLPPSLPLRSCWTSCPGGGSSGASECSPQTRLGCPARPGPGLCPSLVSVGTGSRKERGSSMWPPTEEGHRPRHHKAAEASRKRPFLFHTQISRFIKKKKKKERKKEKNLRLWRLQPRREAPDWPCLQPPGWVVPSPRRGSLPEPSLPGPWSRPQG